MLMLMLSVFPANAQTTPVSNVQKCHAEVIGQGIMFTDECLEDARSFFEGDRKPQALQVQKSATAFAVSRFK